MKIIKFLHASNFQLHLPVICWTSPSSAAENVSSLTRALPVTETLNEGRGTQNPETNALLKGLSGNNPFPPLKNRMETESDEVLPLERLDFTFRNGAFPNLSAEIYEECLSAAWESARVVFDLAIEQNVDFILLTGDIIHPDLTGIRGFAFLAKQFQRLKERGISVYWKLEHSLDNWKLPDFHFPENVFLFPSSESHIKKFHLPDSSKSIFIVSWDSFAPNFSHYDLSQLPDGKLPFFQTIALCPNEKSLGNASFPSEAEAISHSTDSSTPNFDEEKNQNSMRETFSSSSPSNPLENFSENLNAWDSMNNARKKTDLTDLFSGTIPNFHTDSGSYLDSASNPVPNSENKHFFSASSTTSTVDSPFCEAAFTAITHCEKRLTQKRNWKNSIGEERQMIIHAPGPIQYHSPDIFELSKAPIRPAGVTIVQQDLDGDIPVSLQFFPTESISWKFLEKRVPGNISSWDELSQWMKNILIQEFSEINTAEIEIKNTLEKKTANQLPQDRHSDSTENDSSPAKRSSELSTPKNSKEKNVTSENANEKIAGNQSVSEMPAESGGISTHSFQLPPSKVSKRTLVFWKLSSEKPAQSELLRVLLEEGITPEHDNGQTKTQILLEDLRTAGTQLPACPWTVSISVDRHGLIPYSWGQADSMLGDFLRLTQFHLINPDDETKSPDFAPHSLNLDNLLEDDQRDTILNAMTNLTLNEEMILLELASVLGAAALAKAQEGRNK